MKKVYEKPMMSVENFAANEFIAACGDHGENVYFKCNAPGGPLYYFEDFDGKLDGIQNGKMNATHGPGFFYHPCYKEGHTGGFHKVNMDKDPGYSMFDGFIDSNINGKYDEGKDIRIIVWLGENRNNSHGTKELDVDSWTTAKS